MRGPLLTVELITSRHKRHHGIHGVFYLVLPHHFYKDWFTTHTLRLCFLVRFFRMAPRPYSMARPQSFAVGPTIQEGVEDVDIVPSTQEEDEEEGESPSELAGSSAIEQARLALEGTPSPPPPTKRNSYIGSGPRANIAGRRRTRVISMDVDPLSPSPIRSSRMTSDAAPTTPIRDRNTIVESEPPSPSSAMSPTTPTSPTGRYPTTGSRLPSLAPSMASVSLDPSTALRSNPARPSVAPSMASVNIDPSTALRSNPARPSVAPSVASMNMDPTTSRIASVDIDPSRWPATPTSPRRARPISEAVDPLTPPPRSPYRPPSFHEDSAPTTPVEPTTPTSTRRAPRPMSSVDPLTPPPRVLSRTDSSDRMQPQPRTSTFARRARPISEAVDPLTPPSANRTESTDRMQPQPRTPTYARRARPISEAVDPLTPPSASRARPMSEAVDPITPTGNRMESIDPPQPIHGSRNTSFSPDNRYSTLNSRGASVAQGDEIRRRPSSAAFAGSQRPSISIQNVVIPAHLIKHAETSWQQDKLNNRRQAGVKREDTRKSFNIEQMALDQQEEIKNILGATGRSASIAGLNKPGNRSSFAGNRMSYAGSTRDRPMSVIGNKRISFMQPDEKTDEIGNAQDDTASQQSSNRFSTASGGNKRFSTASGGNKRFSTAGSIANKRMSTASIGGNKRWSASVWSGFSFGGESGPTDPSAMMPAAGDQLGALNQPGSRLSWMPTAGADGPTPGERRPSLFQRSASIWQETKQRVASKVRRSSLWDVYENAKKRQVELRRSRKFQLLFEYTFYLFCICFLYFVLVGRPLWGGAIYWLYYVFRHKFNVPYTWTVVLVVAFL